MSGKRQRETSRGQEGSCLSCPSCLSRQETPHVSYDNRGKSSESHKMEIATVTELRMLDRRMERLRSGKGRVLPMDEAFAELDATIRLGGLI